MTGELAEGFAQAVRAWLLVLLDRDARARPRSHGSINVCFSAVRPFIQRWSADYDHLREVTPADVRAALDPLRGHQFRTAIAALRSLFRFARKRGLVFANPAMRLKTGEAESCHTPPPADTRPSPRTSWTIRSIRPPSSGQQTSAALCLR